jgi:hypothetical protein
MWDVGGQDKVTNVQNFDTHTNSFDYYGGIITRIRMPLSL